jgi:transcriptional regulator
MPELYTKPEWTARDPAEAFDLIDRIVIGVFVTQSPAGLAVSHLPFLLDRSRGANGTLTSHLALANEHVVLVQEGAPSVAVFLAEHGYISSSWYPRTPVRDNAPTWNFAVVHCHGCPDPMTPQMTARHLRDLVNHMEMGRKDRWQLSELGPGGMERRLPHIQGFELRVERCDAKFKMGQDERWLDTRAAIEKLRDGAGPSLGNCMEHYNRDRE